MPTFCFSNENHTFFIVSNFFESIDVPIYSSNFERVLIKIFIKLKKCSNHRIIFQNRYRELLPFENKVKNYSLQF